MVFLSAQFIKMYYHKLCVLFLLLIGLFSCKEEQTANLLYDYQTEKVIIIVIDGTRYSETTGHPTHQYLPKMFGDLAPRGIVNTAFYNNDVTYTISGHSSIVTGNYEDLLNNGLDQPKNPTIFQLFLNASQKDTAAAWVIASKAKLESIAKCTNCVWENQFTPTIRCGENGLGTPDRTDEATATLALDVLKNQQPELALISFKDPDVYGHQNNWESYLSSITQTDEYIHQIWEFIQTDSFYKGTTTLFVTNDHGRHLDGVADGFKSHGDDCEGCRHLFFYASGPDFKQDTILDTHRELPDIAATTARLLNFHIPKTDGEVMEELFE